MEAKPARRPGIKPKVFHKKPKKPRQRTERQKAKRRTSWKRRLRDDSCGVCLATENLTEHHCVPRARGGIGEKVTLCWRCHQDAHRIWGDGHHFLGPNTARGTVEALRDIRGNLSALDSLVAREEHQRRRLIRLGIQQLLSETKQAP